MWRRFPDAPGCTVLLIRLYVYVFLAKYLDTQEFPEQPPEYGFGIKIEELFYDTHSIPDGLEVSPYLLVNTTKKFFFLLESKIDRLDITVTPCASPIIWTVTYKSHQEHTPKYDLGNDIENAVVGIQPVLSRRDEVLYTLSGELAETLRLDDPTPGIYTLEVTSTKTDSYVHIFVTTTPDVYRFPEVPKDSNVSEKEVTSKSFTVSWNPSPDEQHFENDIEYCVAVNRKRNFKTLCSVTSHIHGDAKPTLPPNSGFGFSTDVAKRRYLKQKAKPIQPAKRGSIFFQCIGNEKKFVYDKIRKGKGYHVNVFVKNNKTGASRHYKGVYIKTKRKSSLPRLKDGKTKNVVLSRGKSKSYTFKVKRSQKTVYFSVNTCSGKTKFEVKDSNNSLLTSSTVKRSEILTLNDLKPDTYTVTLSKSTKRRKNVYISMTSVSKKVKTPSIPIDTTVKVFKPISDCNSITVAWQGTYAKQTYCLYKTELQSSSARSSAKKILKKLNQCGALNRLENNSKKITCKQFRYSSKDRSVLAITVAGLKPDTNYIFDVFVRKGKHFLFPYNSVRTKTEPKCSNPT